MKGYGFLSFAKNMGNKYSQTLLDSAKKSTTDAIKTASKRAITSVSNKKSTKELLNNDEREEGVEITTHKKRYVSPEERRQIIDELRLVPKNY